MNREKNCYPKIHFSPKYGWMNDPNGLVYHNGIYELYYQYNPYGTEWGNMTWGHARTKDFLSYEELEPVLHPDENGTMFSGCGIVNERGLLGLPKDALLFFYTAAGGTNKESEGKEFTIRLAYSIDGGNTLVKFGGPVLQSLACENRDPKVFWHEESQAYILVLWLEEEDFGIFRSTDLEWFELSQRISLEGGFECPDLFCLSVEGTTDKKWVFWAADGSYYVGEFDGYQFTQTQERKKAYEELSENGECKASIAYAAQTYSGIGNKVMSIPWLKTQCVQQQTTGVQGLPRYFSLLLTAEGYVLRQELPEFVREGIRELQLGKIGVTGGGLAESNMFLVDGLLALGIKTDKPTSVVLYGATKAKEEAVLSIDYQLNNHVLTIRANHKTVVMKGIEGEKITILYDRGVMEISAECDTRVLYCDFPMLREVNVRRAEVL